MLLPDKYNFNKQKLNYNKNLVKITACIQLRQGSILFLKNQNYIRDLETSLCQ